MKVAVAQLNCTLGDLAGNSARILAYVERARQQGAVLLLTPELSLCGYPPEDLLLRGGFVRACARANSLQRVDSAAALGTVARTRCEARMLGRGGRSVSAAFNSRLRRQRWRGASGGADDGNDDGSGSPRSRGG